MRRTPRISSSKKVLPASYCVRVDTKNSKDADRHARGCITLLPIPSPSLSFLPLLCLLLLPLFIIIPIATSITNNTRTVVVAL